MSIYEHNSSFDQSLGTKKFVIGCVVDNVQDTDFTVAGLGSPGEVTGFETEGAELGEVFGSNLGHDTKFGKSNTLHYKCINISVIY